MDSLKQSNSYLPAWSVRYLHELVQRSGYDLALLEWSPAEERVGYTLRYAVGEGWSAFHWYDWQLCEMYTDEVLDMTAELIVQHIERIAENGNSEVSP